MVSSDNRITCLAARLTKSNVPLGVLPAQTHKGDTGPNPSSREELLDFEPEDILTAAELANRLKVSEAWLKEKTRSRNRNKIPTLRLGRYIRFHWPDVCRWLQTNSGVGQ
jgi:hypothetical protein